MDRLANDARVCRRCGAESPDQAARCSRCGGPVATARTIRVLGWVLVGLGSFIVALMSAITYYAAQAVSRADDGVARARFTGSPGMAIYMFGLFGLVLLFGLSCVASGAWQAYSARTNRKLMLIFLGLGLFFFIAVRGLRLYDF